MSMEGRGRRGEVGGTTPTTGKKPQPDNKHLRVKGVAVEESSKSRNTSNTKLLPMKVSDKLLGRITV